MGMVPIDICREGECICPMLGFSDPGHNVLLSPWPLIWRVLEKAIHNRAKLVVWFPHCPRAPWWPLFLELVQGKILLHQGPMFHDTCGRLLRAPKWSTCFAGDQSSKGWGLATRSWSFEGSTFGKRGLGHSMAEVIGVVR